MAVIKRNRVINKPKIISTYVREKQTPKDRYHNQIGLIKWLHPGDAETMTECNDIIVIGSNANGKITNYLFDDCPKLQKLPKIVFENKDTRPLMEGNGLFRMLTENPVEFTDEELDLSMFWTVMFALNGTKLKDNKTPVLYIPNAVNATEFIGTDTGEQLDTAIVDITGNRNVMIFQFIAQKDSIKNLIIRGAFENLKPAIKTLLSNNNLPCTFEESKAHTISDDAPAVSNDIKKLFPPSKPIYNYNTNKSFSIDIDGLCYDTLKKIPYIIDVSRLGIFSCKGASALNEQPTFTNYHDLTSAKEMFSDCSSLSSIVIHDDNKIEDASGMFDSCSSLVSVNSDNSVKLNHTKDTSNMFAWCKKLESININAPESMHADGMFFQDSNIKTITVNLPKVTSAANMFNGCSQLSSVNGLDTMISLEDANNMFNYCSIVKNISFPTDAATITNMENMFYNCVNLLSLDINTSKANNMKGAFYGCEKLPNDFVVDISSIASEDMLKDAFHGIATIRLKGCKKDLQNKITPELLGLSFEFVDGERKYNDNAITFIE